MSLFSDSFTVSLPLEEAFARAKEALLPLGAQARSNGFVLPGASHTGVFYPLTMRVGVEPCEEGARFAVEGSNMGLGLAQKKIGQERMAQVRGAIEDACKKD